MGQLSDVLRGDGRNATYWCQGCEEAHSLRIEGEGAWGYDGNPDKPTFTPSVLVRSGHFIEGHSGRCWCDYAREHPGEKTFTCHRCHTFIRGGMVEFLGDCSHALAGQTLPLPSLPAHLRDPAV